MGESEDKVLGDFIYDYWMFPFVQRIAAGLILRNRRLVLLEGAGGSGKTLTAKVIASRLAPLFDDRVFWISPELASLEEQLRHVELLTNYGTALGIIDCADEWPDHAATSQSILKRHNSGQHKLQLLILGRDLSFLKHISEGQSFSLYEEPSDRWLWLFVREPLNLNPNVRLFDRMPAFSTRALDRIKRMTTSGEYADKHIRNIPKFSIGAIVTLEKRVSDGALVRVIDPIYSEIISAFQRDSSLMYQLSPRQWEELVAATYKKAGFDDVVLTPRSGDLGRDVIAVKKGFGSVRFVEQVKAYKAAHIVTADEVRALLGVLHADQNASKAIFSTTSHFAPRIASDKLIKPFLPHRLELVDRETLLSRLIRRTD